MITARFTSQWPCDFARFCSADT